MSGEVRRGTVLSFSASDWTALVMLDGADAESQIPVGQWVPASMMVAAAEVAVLVFGDTNTDDAVVLGPYGAVSLWNFPAIGAAANGQLLIGNGSGLVLAAITGTANRVTVTNGPGTITLSGPQDLATTSAPTFDTVTVGQQGTFTPIFIGTGTAGTFTYTAQLGFYFKIGGMVFFWLRVTISAITVAPTGNMQINGLPFAAAATYHAPVSFGYINNFKNTALAIQLVGFVAAGASAIPLYESFTNGAAVQVPAANFTNAACDLMISGFYKY
jgi:hypothetical protein